MKGKLLSPREMKARILSLVLDFFHRNNWQDIDDFSMRFVDRISPNIQNCYLPYHEIWNATKIRTSFFISNHLSRRTFCDSFVHDLLPLMNEIGVTSSLGAVSFRELFPEVADVSMRDAEAALIELRIPERRIQDALRNSLREKGATNITLRKSDSSLEVADIEDFTLQLKRRDISLASIVKGYKSVKGNSVTLRDISHQVMKAYNGTFPDYILLVLAKPPADGVVTNLVRYGESVGNRNLVIVADPVELARFLLANSIVSNSGQV